MSNNSNPLFNKYFFDRSEGFLINNLKYVLCLSILLLGAAVIRDVFFHHPFDLNRINEAGIKALVDCVTERKTKCDLEHYDQGWEAATGDLRLLKPLKWSDTLFQALTSRCAEPRNDPYYCFRLSELLVEFGREDHFLSQVLARVAAFEFPLKRQPVARKLHGPFLLVTENSIFRLFRWDAIEMLGILRYRDPEIDRTLRHALQDRELRVRMSALWAITHGNENQVPSDLQTSLATLVDRVKKDAYQSNCSVCDELNLLAETLGDQTGLYSIVGSHPSRFISCCANTLFYELENASESLRSDAKAGLARFHCPIVHTRSENLAQQRAKRLDRLGYGRRYNEFSVPGCKL